MTPDQLSTTIVAALDGLVDGLALPARLPVGAGLRRPRLSAHGDWTTNVALLLADEGPRSALELAELLADRLRDTAGIRSVEVAPPGFLNLRLDVGWSVADRVLKTGRTYVDVGPAPLGAVLGDPHAGSATDADPLYLLQRAHARTCSLLRAGAELGIAAGHDEAPPPSARDAVLLRLLAGLPEVAAVASRREDWQRLGRALQEVATALLALDPAVLPRGDEPPTGAHRARLLLVAATQVALDGGLRSLSVTPAERW